MMGSRSDNDKAMLSKEYVLRGHAAAIESLAISPDGRMLVSGDDDSVVIVWDLRTGEKIQSISSPFNGAIGAVAWIQLRDTNDPSFVFGCADGSLHIYSRKTESAVGFERTQSINEAHPGAVEDITFDFRSNRLATVGAGQPQVWRFADEEALVPCIHEPRQKALVARNVFFCDDGLLVTYLESHEIFCYTIEPWAVKWRRLLRTRIGNAKLCQIDGNRFFVSNLLDGVDQYNFPDFRKIRTLFHEIESNHPLQVTTVRKGRWVVCGGDNGYAHVFDSHTGELLHLLKHDTESKLVQTITAHDSDDGCIIVTAQSGLGNSTIAVWKERKPTRTGTEENFDQPPSFQSKFSLFQVLHVSSWWPFILIGVFLLNLLVFSFFALRIMYLVGAQGERE